MNDPNVFGYQPDGPGQQLTPGAPGPRQSSSIQAPYKFSPDELRVLGECNRESFFQRSLPLGTSLGVGTYIAIQKGYLKPNARFGALPKMSFAILVGYFVGKLSYQETCAEKLMALPGSYIGQLLREKKEGRAGSTNMQNTPGMFGAGPNDIYSDAGPGSSLNLDTDRPVFSGDDSYRSDNKEGGGFPSLDPEKKRPALSYDDLRRKNRGEYTEARQDPYRLDPNSAPPVSRAAPVVERMPAPPKTNKYGDAID